MAEGFDFYAEFFDLLALIQAVALKMARAIQTH
jgi:hypothetical protein